MRLLMVTQFYAPEPVPKVAFLARRLAERGHKVTVLTGLPCYPEGRIFSEYKGKFFLTEYAEGVEVIRVPQVPDHSASAARRILYYLSFPFFAAFRLITLSRREFDVAYFYGSAVPALALSTAVRLAFRIRCVFDVADLWPESVESSGMLRAPKLLKALSSLCGFLYRRADHIGAVTKGYKERLMAHGISSDRISVTYYCVQDFHPVMSATSPKTQPFTVVFTGMIGRPQNLDVLLDAAKLLSKEAVPVRFLVAGSGVECDALVKRAKTENLESVTFLGRLPSAAMPALYAEADALFVHLKPDSLSAVTIPSKTYSYMAASKPIIMAVDGEAGNFIEEHQCGIRAKAGDAKAIAQAIISLSKMSSEERAAMGKNARTMFECKFSPQAHILLWEQLLERFSTARTPDCAPLTGAPTLVR